MVRKVLICVALLCILVYLVLAMASFNKKPMDTVCTGIELIIKDTLKIHFITREEIASALEKKGLYPVGKKMTEISTFKVEEELEKNSLIDRVECYKTPSDKICVEIYQRIPILRVMNQKNDYFIDNQGAIMPHNTKCVSHLIIVTGNVEKSFATNELYNFGVFLHNNPFWDAQIEQINVLSNQEIELVPRVGNHIIHLGKLDDFEDKLDRLKDFYIKGLNSVGWNKYKRINLEYSNQIICTKR